jgi:D-alanyl-D-alanine carboxypeptidase (penicillin-binding protein 5/6)
MKLHRIKIALLCTVLSLAAPAAAVHAENLARSFSGPELQALSAVLIDQETGTVLFEKNADIEIPPASLTKLMTMHLLLSEIESGRRALSDTVEVPPAACWTNLPPGSSLMFLGPGQTVTLEELLLGLAVSSGNDAARAVAIILDESVESFVERMNREADGLGFRNIRFRDPAGLSPENRVTAREFARFCRLYIELHPESLERFHSRREFTYPKAVGAITQRNRNLLLWTYDDLDGLKTGYIDESGYNVALTAERDGMRLIAVILGGRGETHPEGRRLLAEDGATLLDYGFENWVQLRPEGIDYGSVTVWKGQEDAVTLEPAVPVVVTVGKECRNRLEISFERSSYLTAPVLPGTPAGTMTVRCADREIGIFPLQTVSAVEEAGAVKRLFHSLAMWVKRIKK